MAQFSVPCSVYRGGTSKGLFFQKKDLPADIQIRNKIFLRGIDSYNPSQLDGLGGTTTSSSKVCVISPSERQGVHIDWSFYQLSIAQEVVDEKGTCGNLMAAVGAFAVDEGLVRVDAEAEQADVFVYNTNIKKVLHIKVPIVNGKAKVSGDYHMPGMVKPGAMFRVAIVKPGGEMTGKLLLLGARTEIKTEKNAYEVTFADLINPFIFVTGKSVGLKGSESYSEVASNEELMEELNLIRDKMAVAAGMSATVEEARYEKPNVPKLAVVSPAQDYVTTAGELIKKEQVDILTKVVSMRELHLNSPASGLYNLAAMCMLPGTVPNQLAGFPQGTMEQMVRIGHAEGIVEVLVTLTPDGQLIEKIGMERTVRRIIRGELFTPVS